MEMKNCIRLFIFNLYVLTLVGCSSGFSPSLLDVESHIQEAPEQALSELMAINADDLRSGQDKALYSLLLSMALDKNYIDLQSDSIVAPAVKYFSSSVDRYHKFLSYYCLGRVQENAEDYGKALSSYIEAGRVDSRHIPLDYQTRLHTRKGTVYYRQFALDRALGEYEKAMELSKTLTNPAFYISCVLDVASTEEALGNSERALSLVEDLKQWLDKKGLSAPPRFYRSRLFSLLKYSNGAGESLDTAFTDYVAACAASRQELDHPLAADYYLRAGNLQMAEAELAKVDPDALVDLFSTAGYYASLASLQMAQGREKESLATHEYYEGLLSQANLDIYNSDVRFLEERARAEKEQQITKHRTTLLMAFLALALVAVAFVLYTKKSSLHRVGYEEARRQVIKPLITSDNPSLLADEIKKLLNSNKEYGDLLHSTVILFNAYYPAFVAELSGRGLTTEEIGLCCLYLYGYSTKELSSSPTSHRLYNVNTNIRKKLDIPANSEKISTWIKRIFDEVSASH